MHIGGQREAEKQFLASVRDAAIRLRPFCPGFTDEEFERLVCKAALVQVKHTMPSAIFDRLRENAAAMCPDEVRSALASLSSAELNQSSRSSGLQNESGD